MGTPTVRRQMFGTGKLFGKNVSVSAVIARSFKRSVIYGENCGEVGPLYFMGALWVVLSPF